MLPTNISLSNNKQFGKQFELLQLLISDRRQLVTLIRLSAQRVQRAPFYFCTSVFYRCFISFLIRYKREERNQSISVELQRLITTGELLSHSLMCCST